MSSRSRGEVPKLVERGPRGVLFVGQVFDGHRLGATEMSSPQAEMDRQRVEWSQVMQTY